MNGYVAACMVAATLTLLSGIVAWKLDRKAGLNRLVIAKAGFTVVRATTMAFLTMLPSESGFWFLVDVSYSSTIVALCLSLAVHLSFAEVKGLWRWVILGPLLAVSVLELVALWTGTWLVTGSHLAEEGTRVLETTQSVFWKGLYFATVLENTVASVAALGWAFARAKSNRYRWILGQLAVVILAVDIAAWVSGPLAGQLGPRALFIGVHSLNYLILIVLYQALMRSQPPLVEGPLFQALLEPLALIDFKGRVVATSASFDRLWQSLSLGPMPQNLLKAWPKWRSAWQRLAKESDEPVVVEISEVQFGARLILTPKRGPTGIDGVVARLEVPTLEGASTFDLSPREERVAELIREGLTPTGIANCLGISPATVKVHLKHLYEKTETNNRAALWLALGRRGAPSPID